MTLLAALPPVMAAYYESLDAGRADDAVACFSPDVVYAVPDRPLRQLLLRAVGPVLMTR